jgi:hypothetical protein
LRLNCVPQLSSEFFKIGRAVENDTPQPMFQHPHFLSLHDLQEFQFKREIDILSLCTHVSQAALCRLTAYAEARQAFASHPSLPHPYRRIWTVAGKGRRDVHRYAQGDVGVIAALSSAWGQ